MAEAKGVIAYADGSCLGNPGPGGWGVVIIEADGRMRELCGGMRSTTNNRMEITAAIEALRNLPPGTSALIRTDSQYLVKTMTLGWKRSANPDLWRELDAEVARHRVRWEWVRGHAGDPMNERADELARNAALGKPVARSIQPAKALAPAPRSVDEEAAVVAELRPLLGDRESLRRCAGCGRMFVARVEAVAETLAYCALANCQLKARKPQ
jgi:ribonuclease HI